MVDHMYVESQLYLLIRYGEWNASKGLSSYGSNEEGTQTQVGGLGGEVTMVGGGEIGGTESTQLVRRVPGGGQRISSG